MTQALFAYCPQALYGNGCEDPTCSLVHDAKYCEVCAVICEPESKYKDHISNQQHIKKASFRWKHCILCNVTLSGEVGWSSHIQGRAHAKKASQRGIPPTSVKPEIPPDYSPISRVKRCGTCNIHIAEVSWESHISGRLHKIREQHASLRARFDQFTKDQNGVVVSHGDSGLDFGVVSMTDAAGGVLRDLVVMAGGSSQITVVSAQLHTKSNSKHKKSKAYPPFSVTSQLPVEIAPDQPLPLSIRFQSVNRGLHEGLLALSLRRSDGQPFAIARRLKVAVGSPADHEALKPTAPYVHRRRVPWRSNLPIVSGERPPSLLAAQWVKALPKARIPDKLAELLHSGTPDDVATRVKEKYLDAVLKSTNHGQHFAILLWIEESRTVEDMRRYDMIDVNFVKEGKLYILEVPGLAEKRPSVMIGDVIKVQASEANEGKTHEGFVHDVRMETIRVSFHGSFQAGRRYNVCFQFNRVPLRRQHQALNSSSPTAQRLLFPLPGQEGLERPLGPNDHSVQLFNPLIATNPAQLQAVISCLKLREGCAPFVIFGPPGTGKTVTDVEAILQILHANPEARILACAPSNSAADIIALRLIALSTDELFRCNAAYRNPLTVPEALAPYTLHMTNHYAIPPLDTLKKYRVIVSTCGNASFAYNVGMERGHFTHIFVDEAGQATEPEVLTTIKTMASEQTRIILSGDPKQLGPIVRSTIAREHGLGVSYMERLMELPIYDRREGRAKSWIKLLRNYRSHKSILHYPNTTFYDGELEVCGNRAVTDAFLGSSLLVSPTFPVIFHALAGHNDREASSPSYFNIDEASEVKAYIDALLADRSHPIQARDIGVITPYHAQVRKIRKLLRDSGIADVHVGSVEEFQGQECRAVIISTVRTSAGLLAYDAKFTLGFVSNPRRFNVAVTRAQALLVVIGDPSILAVDPIWRGFMNYVHARGGWRGDAPTWDVDAPVRPDGDYADELEEAQAADMSAFMAHLGVDGADPGDLEGEANVDRPFQEDE